MAGDGNGNLFFATCMLVAGLDAGISLKRSILMVQALSAFTAVMSLRLQRSADLWQPITQHAQSLPRIGIFQCE